MHELSIALSILDAADEQMARLGDARVSALHVRVGPLSGVIPQALVSAFELARTGTAFAACKLIIEETAVIVRCPACRMDRPVRSIQDIACSVCGTATSDLAGGRELELRAMEIDE
jgi:hydrogenase nickel incorporation protein HypA/HybF